MIRSRSDPLADTACHAIYFIRMLYKFRADTADGFSVFSLKGTHRNKSTSDLITHYDETSVFIQDRPDQFLRRFPPPEAIFSQKDGNDPQPRRTEAP